MVQTIVLFFNLRRTEIPFYLYAELPIGRTEQYDLRNMREYDVPLARRRAPQMHTL